MTSPAEVSGTFGERLRAHRAAAGLSQQELAERSGVSVRAIGDMERGRTRWPQRDSARCLVDALRLAGQDREEFLALARRPIAAAGEPEPGVSEWPQDSRAPTGPVGGDPLHANGEREAGLGHLPRAQASPNVLQARQEPVRRRAGRRWRLAVVVAAALAVALGVPLALMSLKPAGASAPPRAKAPAVSEQISTLNRQLGHAKPADRVRIMQRLMVIANKHPDTASVSNRVITDLLSFAVSRSRQPRPAGDPPDLRYALQAIGGSHGNAFVDTPNLTKYMNGADLAGLNLTGLQFNTAVLAGADLRGADLRDAGLVAVVLTRARLQHANLADANLARANLTAAQLQNADLRGAKLKHADFSGADLSGADLSGADLTGAAVSCRALARAKHVPAAALAHCGH